MVSQALAGSLHLAGVDVMLDGANAEAVLLASDIAMYRSKAQGKHQVTVFDASLREASELRLVYPPLLTPDGRIAAAEALVRWQHPQRGFISPADFIPVAESSGLIVELGAWVLAEAACQVVRWTQAGLPAVNVAVNVSPRQLRGGVLIAQYRQALGAAGCDARHLSIELTEDSLVEDIDENTQQLLALRALGAQIAIDDFGTGQSSLSCMKRLPVDKLTIDQSFVAGLPDDRGDRAIVAAALSMAHALGLQVVAEGVETEAQCQWLCAIGGNLLQGYHFSRPVPADAFAALLRQQVAPPTATPPMVTAIA